MLPVSGACVLNDDRVVFRAAAAALEAHVDRSFLDS